jgi:hypothetical protein
VRAPTPGRCSWSVAIDHARGTVLGRRQVPSKRGEGMATRDLLTGPDTDWTEATAVEEDRGRGLVERRTIRVAPPDGTLFPGAARAFRLHRDTGGPDSVREHKEIVYGSPVCPPTWPAQRT